MDTKKEDDTTEMSPSSNGPDFLKKDKNVSNDIDDDGEGADYEGNETEIVRSLGEGSLNTMNEDDPKELSSNEPKISKPDKNDSNDLEADKDRVNEEDCQPE